MSFSSIPDETSAMCRSGSARQPFSRELGRCGAGSWERCRCSSLRWIRFSTRAQPGTCSWQFRTRLAQLGPRPTTARCSPLASRRSECARRGSAERNRFRDDSGRNSRARASAADRRRRLRAGDFFLMVYPHPVLGNGDGANKPWLQELPDPVTKIAWQTVAEIHPSTAKRLGVENGDHVTGRDIGRESFAPCLHISRGSSRYGRRCGWARSLGRCRAICEGRTQRVRPRCLFGRSFRSCDVRFDAGEGDEGRCLLASRYNRGISAAAWPGNWTGDCCGEAWREESRGRCGRRTRRRWSA